MRAVFLDSFGDESVLRIGETAPPPMGPHELRIAVHTTAVNRADLLQRQGHYPPPPGASELLGLECAGVVLDAGSDVHGWRRGDRVMALLPGGGYAEEVTVDAGSAMHIPESMSYEEAGALPEAFLTAFLTIFELGRAKRGESVLVHGGGSSIGTAATTLCKLAGMHVTVTAGSREKCERCLAHGADEAINYREVDFVERLRNIDIVLDHLGAAYLTRDLQVLAIGGRVVIIGSMGGERMIQLDVSALLEKRQQIIGSMLRARPKEEKAAIVTAFLARFGAELFAGRVRPVIHRVLPFEAVADAHRLMKSGEHFGKIVLRVR
ncbi:MAG TPA: NAD(P)H-quinone oxidoreductase [Thermoanaerobaculia bacterium]|nr:NAD(P)H-quinone oxidoreductase [Thermoanaerobaculia bacterium]